LTDEYQIARFRFRARNLNDSSYFNIIYFILLYFFWFFLILVHIFISPAHPAEFPPRPPPPPPDSFIKIDLMMPISKKYENNYGNRLFLANILIFGRMEPGSGANSRQGMQQKIWELYPEFCGNSTLTEEGVYHVCFFSS
jgi:hypothetical protein